MALYFFDSGALVKRYVQEVGTPWVRSLASPSSNVLYIAQITAVETVAAITLRARRGNTSSSDAAAAIADLRHDYLREYVLLPITVAVISNALNLAERHGLRGYDAVQLACACQMQQERHLLLLPALTFLSADTALNAAAVAEGLAVDDPNAHP